MLLNEMWESTDQAYQDISDDNSQTRLSSTRQTRLTLRQISKLRQLNDIRTAEYHEKIENVQKQYGATEQPMVGGAF
jgi:hypothetical protein